MKSVRKQVVELARRGVRRLAGRASGAMGSFERDASWYDAVYRDSPGYRARYAASPYYFLWCVIVDRMLREPAHRVLDLGCGPGQFACFLRDKGIRDYHGIDFSAVAVARARECCPEYRFTVEDLTRSIAAEREEYDWAVSLEVLEHVGDDLGIVRRIRNGARVALTVPNFPSEGHVRVFGTEAEVLARYGRFFSRLEVTRWEYAQAGQHFYLLDGVRGDPTAPA